MGCASSKEEAEEITVGPVAGKKKQFIESGNYGAPKHHSESPKYVKVRQERVNRGCTNSMVSQLASLVYATWLLYLPHFLV